MLTFSFFVAGSFGITIFFLLIFFLKTKPGRPNHSGTPRERGWIERLPVSPLVRLVARRQGLDRLIGQADLGPAWNFEKTLRYLEWSLWAALGSIVLLSDLPVAERLLYAGACLALALLWPRIYIKRSIRRRREAAARHLPEFINRLRLYVSAGHNLESAFILVSGRPPEEWARPLARTRRRLALGVSFAGAVTALAAELAIPEFNRVVFALKQARQLGVPLGVTLALQSELVRRRQKQQAEEAARVAAVKITLPLVLCIFPALLIVYLAPAVLRIMRGL